MPRKHNTPPVAVDDALSLHGVGPDDVWVLGNHSDSDHEVRSSEVLAVVSFTQPAHGQVDCERSSCSYTADEPLATGTTDEFTYTVSDQHGGRSTATVTVQPRSFVGEDDVLTLPVNKPATFDVLANDTGPVLGTDYLEFKTPEFPEGTLESERTPEGPRPGVDAESGGRAGTVQTDYALFDTGL